jgi:DNA-directed RNA polymerase specialized sigma24 family protein
MPEGEKGNNSHDGDASFPQTQWSIVLAAGDGQAAREALDNLCRTYWYPLYVYAKHRIKNTHDAEDLTQAFFERLLGKNALRTVGKQKGRFRSFLLASFNHFLNNDWDRAKTLKRGGHCTFVSLDAASSDERLDYEPAHAVTPEKIFEQRWVVALLEQVMKILREEYEAAGKASAFLVYEKYLVGDDKPASYARAAEELGTTTGAARVSVCRVRRRYQELLRAQIAHTVESPKEIEDEIRYLFAAVEA